MYLQVDQNQAAAIEKATRKQSKSKRWHLERKYRVTASNFHAVIKSTERRNMQKLCMNLHGSTPLRTKPIIHGQTFEATAIKKFEEREGLKVEKCGLYVRTDLPFLGASPDGLVGEDTIVEVKCPYTGRNDVIMANKAFKFLTTNAQGDLELKKSHAYYTQIQGQLYITKCNVCYFVVYTFQDLLILKINRNDEFCDKELIPKLYGFFTTHYRPYLANLL
jgi:putative phage-type endonuclease